MLARVVCPPLFLALGFLVTKALLSLLPTLTLRTSSSITYRDDAGVCYTYDEVPVPC